MPNSTSKQRARQEFIGQITNQTVSLNRMAESQSYGPLRLLLTSSKAGINISPECVVVDAQVPNGSERPDVQLWLEGVPAELRNENEHLYAIFEGKSGNGVEAGGRRLAHSEISTYRYARLNYFWLYDSYVVHRFDLRGADDIPDPQVFTWVDIASSDSVFDDCFGPLTEERRTLRGSLQDFSRVTVPLGQLVSDERHGEFVASLITTARILSRAVSRTVDYQLKGELREAFKKIEPMALEFGKPLWDWTTPHEFLQFSNEPDLSDIDRFHEFNRRYTDLIGALSPHLFALRAETEYLPAYAERVGLQVDALSLLKDDKNSKQSRMSFVQETSTLLFSRIIMIRFSEDYGVLPRYISNGGLKAFAQYAEHFHYPFQKLVREAYEFARRIYHHLFDEKTLDWILDQDDPELGEDILHALWILARWEFKSVHGDLLSGVYDKYLEPSQRQTLGEIYTRPELARYMLAACGWDGSQTLLDPACGSGTFLVEALDMRRQDLLSAGVPFEEKDALGVIENLNGTDLNHFSATLAQIQLLWHLLALQGAPPEEAMKRGLQRLNVAGGFNSLETWGESMVADHRLFDDRVFRANRERQETRVDANRSLTTEARRFRDITSGHEHYDIVIGNPPYVRVHRMQWDEATRLEYRDVLHGQTDMSALFVYRSLRWWLKPGGKMAFVLPLALTEAAYAERLRVLMSRYKLCEIVDLELLRSVVFHGANIVTAIWVVEKSPASPDDAVIITTVTPECYDTKRNFIDMSKARRDVLTRNQIELARYLPQSENEISDGDGDKDDASDTGWLTKLRTDDVAILDHLSQLPRLVDYVDQAYAKHQGSRIVARAAEIPAGQQPQLWRKNLILGYGVKIGGHSPHHSDGKPVLKGANVYPDGVEGTPFAEWNGTPSDVDTVRFYGWEPVFDVRRSFIFRNIAQMPTCAPHPDGYYLNNSSYIIQLRQEFPLNIYVLSRIVSWFMLKTARTSVVQKFFVTWYRRNFLRVPFPRHISETLTRQLSDVGDRMIALDCELVNRFQRLEMLSQEGSPSARPLKERLDLLDSGTVSRPLDVSWPGHNGNSWIGTEAIIQDTKIRFITPTRLFPELHAPTETGVPCEIDVKDARLRQWVLFQSRRLLAAEKVPNASWLANVPIPKDLDAALDLLNRVESHQADIELSEAWDDLDVIVSDALGLSDAERQYIVRQMDNDPLWLQLRPSWRHRNVHPRAFVEYGGQSRY